MAQCRVGAGPVEGSICPVERPGARTQDGRVVAELGSQARRGRLTPRRATARERGPAGGSPGWSDGVPGLEGEEGTCDFQDIQLCPLRGKTSEGQNPSCSEHPNTLNLASNTIPPGQGPGFSEKWLVPGAGEVCGEPGRVPQ